MRNPRPGPVDLHAFTPAHIASISRRFWAKVEKTDSCWLWTAARTSRGYGHFNVKLDGAWRMLLAHRVAYLLTHGSIPVGLQLDHTCRVRACVRPSHLEPVTQQENIARGNSPAAITARTGVCQRGHQMTPENTYVRRDGTSRWCRECRRIRERAWRARVVA